MAYTWYESLSECVRLKMTLLTVDSASKRHQLANAKLSDASQVWIGGHDLKVDRSFEWISNSKAFVYTYWNKGEPNSGEEHCVEMIFPSMYWNDVRCIKKRGFICEETPIAVEKNQEIAKLKADLTKQAGLLNEKIKQLAQLELQNKANKLVAEQVAKQMQQFVQKINLHEKSINEGLVKILNVALNQTDVLSQQKDILVTLKTDQEAAREDIKLYHKDVTKTQIIANSMKENDRKMDELFTKLTAIQEVTSNQNSSKPCFYIYF
ncbi:lectin subunit alpha-like [Musca vetustissima]|uniref:lectin subunit alpha-like n=1 Tax=Musca vetustissima TaxID=27455 RepID=UPI002AB76B54|nr:lectin subunit alpha-like [Musca vetustissima]